MAKIDLGGDIRNTDKPMPHTVVNDNTGMAGIAATQRANDRLAAGMRHVSEAVLGISMDMKRDEVNEETVNAQIEYYDRSQEALRRLSERRIYNQDEYKAAFNAEMDRVDSEMQKWAKENTSWGESRKALELISKGGRSRNFAQAMGGFLNAKAQRKAQLLEYNYNRLTEAGDIANVEVLLNASHLAPETREIWLRKAALKIAENKAKSIAEIENDADRQRAIDLEVESYAIACEGNSADIGTKFLTKTDVEKLHSYYLGLSKENESKNAKKYRESADERIASIMESNGNERKLRVDAFDKFLDECGYLNAQDRFEARGKLEKLVAAEKARNEKAKRDALKLRNLNFKKRTQELFAGNTNIGADELSSIAYIGNAAKSAFSAPDKDENGKITVSIAEKQQSYIEKLQDAIDSYDADADETGVYGRALLYQLDAVFTDDKTQNGKIYAPESERRLRRELGERLGIYPAANIKVESVKEYVSPIFDGVVGKSFSKLKFGQKQVYTQLKQAFIRTAMTAGLNDARELGEWVNKSPYVATLKEKLKLLKGVEDASGFDTDFAYIENRTAKAPNLLGYAMGDMGISYMENAYLKMKNKRDEELSKKENTNGKQ